MKRNIPKPQTHSNKLPEGWRELQGALTAPNGYRWASNGKSRFGGGYKKMLVRESAFRKKK